MQAKKIVLLLLLVVFIGFVYFYSNEWLSFERYLDYKEQLTKSYSENKVIFVVAYGLVYILLAALSLPGAALLTLMGGGLLGFWLALVVVSFASSIGGSLAFLLSRILLRYWVECRFSKQYSLINRGVDKDGAFYLFSLRLIPLFPFFVINLVMGLSSIPLWRFYWVSQIGMLAGTAVYVNAGTQIGQLSSMADILSLKIILSFTLLGLMPWLAKSVVAVLKHRRYFSPFKKPKTFDNNLIVIGAGAAGLVSAYIAAILKAKVTLIEKNKMGGDCLNTGCVPSKALIRSSRIAHYMNTAERYGLAKSEAVVPYSDVMARVKKIINTIEPHDSVERYSELGVNCIKGNAVLVSPWEVEVDGRRLSAKNIIVASGGRPAELTVEGVGDIVSVNSDTVWEMTQLPEHLLIVGGGAIACEMAQAYRRLGCRITMLVRSQLLPKEDEDVALLITEQFRQEGIAVYIQTELKQFKKEARRQTVMFSCEGQLQQVDFDVLLVAIGRNANTENLGFESLGVKCNANGTVEVDEYLKTSCPTVYACGDVAGPYQFTHVASHQAWYAAVNSLLGVFKRFKVDYRVIPWATFIDPEVARVGLSEREAKAKNIAYEVTRYSLDDLDRAITDSETTGFIKILTPPGKDKLLGVTIVGYHASDMIAEYILAMRHGLGLNKILSTVHSYPTFSEANKFVAGVWKQKNKPGRVLGYLQRFHRWRRGI